MKEFVFHGIIQKDEDTYNAVCLELDVNAEGDSPEEARKNLKEAVEVYIGSIQYDIKCEQLTSNPMPEESTDIYFKNLKKLLHSKFYGFRDIVHV